MNETKSVNEWMQVMSVEFTISYIDCEYIYKIKWMTCGLKSKCREQKKKQTEWSNETINHFTNKTIYNLIFAHKMKWKIKPIGTEWIETAPNWNNSISDIHTYTHTHSWEQMYTIHSFIFRPQTFTLSFLARSAGLKFESVHNNCSHNCCLIFSSMFFFCSSQSFFFYMQFQHNYHSQLVNSLSSISAPDLSTNEMSKQCSLAKERKNRLHTFLLIL